MGKRGSKVGTCCTLEEAAKVLGITKSRAGQLEAAAIKKLRAALMRDPDIRELLKPSERECDVLAS